MSAMTAVEHERFAAKITQDGECWTWTASVNSRGYGTFAAGGKVRLAHRVAYETYVDEIPDGLQIDHLCSNRRCVNPQHLEPVTGLVNVRRSRSCQATADACAHGHPWESNAFYTRSGHRRCLTCQRASARASAKRAYVPVVQRQAIAAP
jgi:hypothetical protein